MEGGVVSDIISFAIGYLTGFVLWGAYFTHAWYRRFRRHPGLTCAEAQELIDSYRSEKYPTTP